MNWRKQGAQLSDEKISLKEQQFGITFPPLYKQFLSEINGGYPDRNSLSSGEASTILRGFFSIESINENNDFEKKLKSTRQHLPDGFIAIADDYTGNYLAIANKRDEIYFVDHELDPVTHAPQPVATDIFDLLNKLQESDV